MLPALQLQQNMTTSATRALTRPPPPHTHLAQPDALGIAATLEVEHAAAAPPSLVVADQAARPRGIGRERRLAGACGDEGGRVAVAVVEWAG